MVVQTLRENLLQLHVVATWSMEGEVERGRSRPGSSSAEPGKGVCRVPKAGTERGGVPTEEPMQRAGGVSHWRSN